MKYAESESDNIKCYKFFVKANFLIKQDRGYYIVHKKCLFTLDC